MANSAARNERHGLEMSYQSGSRAIAVLNGRVRNLEIDGSPTKPEMIEENVLALPRGQHLVTLEIEPPAAR